MNLRTVYFLWMLACAASSVNAATINGPWIPKFKGVDYSASTNIPGTGAISTRRQVAHALRVDLADPDLRLLTTPRRQDYLEGSREIGGLTVSGFLQAHHLQAAINANFFDERQYYVPAETPMNLFGLAISEGVIVSPQDGPGHDATIMFDEQNKPAVVFTNWPATTTEGVFTAVTGNYPLLIAGRNVGSRGEVDPRTAFGLSEDHRYLYLICIDGRQSGYSEGSTDFETAAWLLRLGAFDAVNMDGGGSATLVAESSTGLPVRLNKSSAVADSGRERTVGSHFGIYAKPLLGFINDVAAQIEDTTATISFTTLSPAAAEIEYGQAISLGNASALDSPASTNHAITLTGLIPGTDYYFRIAAIEGEQPHFSPIYYLKTTNHVTTNAVFSLTNTWKFTSGPAPQSWTTLTFDDSAWDGPGAGLLWADSRASGPPLPVEPKVTELPINPATGFPYLTYYFRAHFELGEFKPGSSLQFTGFVDDGAVFYLNGTEIHRLRMPAVSTSQTLATGFPCDGDATCPDEFTIPASSLAGVLSRHNVLAVEVHNYNSRSADTTFGLELSRIDPIARSAELKIQFTESSLQIAWDGPGLLQSAPAPDGPWLDAESKPPSPATIRPSDAHRFYRVRN